MKTVPKHKNGRKPGQKASPVNRLNFPAKKITTSLQWEDLVLHFKTREKINEIEEWLNFREGILSEPTSQKKFTAGYKVLFYGKPGTGKNLTAALLGKKYNLPVYRIDVSLLVSKQIEKIEKIINHVLTRAENNSWILFFDEANALFGKRTSVNSSHDRYSNQEVSYLLQRIEEFKGLLIMTSGSVSDLKEAFRRQFDNTIYFPRKLKKTKIRLRSG